MPAGHQAQAARERARQRPASDPPARPVAAAPLHRRRALIDRCPRETARPPASCRSHACCGGRTATRWERSRSTSSTVASVARDGALLPPEHGGDLRGRSTRATPLHGARVRGGRVAPRAAAARPAGCRTRGRGGRGNRRGLGVILFEMVAGRRPRPRRDRPSVDGGEPAVDARESRQTVG